MMLQKLEILKRGYKIGISNGIKKLCGHIIDGNSLGASNKLRWAPRNSYFNSIPSSSLPTFRGLCSSTSSVSLAKHKLDDSLRLEMSQKNLTLNALQALLAVTVKPMGQASYSSLNSRDSKLTLTETAKCVEISAELLGSIIFEAPKRTYKPNYLQRKRKHGFLKRLRKPSGRRILGHRRAKGRRRLAAI